MIGAATTSQPAHGGTSRAWLDGYGATHTDSVSQSVTLPVDCTTASLDFWLHIDTRETGSTVFDRLTVALGGTTVATFSNTQAAAGYQQRTVDVSAFAGRPVALTFTGVEDASAQTSFVLDDVALNVSGGTTTPPPPPSTTRTPDNLAYTVNLSSDATGATCSAAWSIRASCSTRPAPPPPSTSSPTSGGTASSATTNTPTPGWTSPSPTTPPTWPRAWTAPAAGTRAGSRRRKRSPTRCRTGTRTPPARRRVPGLISTDGRGYRLRLGLHILDVDRFTDLAGRPEIPGLVAALALWRGPALAGLNGRALRAAAAALDDRRRAVLRRLAETGHGVVSTVDLPARPADQWVRPGG